MRRWILPLALLVLAACRDDGRTLEPPVFPPPATTAPADEATTLPAAITDVPAVAGPLQLIAPWQDGAVIPVRYTCDGEGISPALTWTNVPDGTVELALTVTDLDAPQYVHWLVFGIAPDIENVAEGTPPPGAERWTNGSGSAEYAGPCPPAGAEHRYLFTVHALNQGLEPADDMDAVEIIEMLRLVSIDQSSVSGVFTRDG